MIREGQGGRLALVAVRRTLAAAGTAAQHDVATDWYTLWAKYGT